MKPAEHRVRMPHLNGVIGPMPARLGLRAIQHVEALASPGRLRRHSVEESRAVRRGNIGEDDEAHPSVRNA